MRERVLGVGWLEMAGVGFLANEGAVLMNNSGTASSPCCWGSLWATSTAEPPWLPTSLTRQPSMPRRSPLFSSPRAYTAWGRRNPRSVFESAGAVCKYLFCVHVSVCVCVFVCLCVVHFVCVSVELWVAGTCMSLTGSFYVVLIMPWQRSFVIKLLHSIRALPQIDSS